MTLDDFYRRFPDEDAARAWFEAARWPNGPECPRCGTVGRAWWLAERKVWSCGGCRGQFSVTAGTPMHGTHLPLRTWLIAMWLMSASSKGISSLKLAEWLGLQHRTTWHLAHRIRAMPAWLREAATQPSAPD
jgi:transposase-like protein